MRRRSRVAHALTRTLRGSYTLSLSLDVEAPHRIVLFSDQHKGAGDLADEFRPCKATYMTALRHYRESGFTLVLLGDVEELWEQRFREVERVHRDVLLAEGSFPAGRYYRIWGNHDDEWCAEKNVRKKLAPYMPTTAVYEALRYEVRRGETTLGTLFLVHGHQGTLGSDLIRKYSRWFVRQYRHAQRLLKIGRTTPAKDACLRGKHDAAMYQWAAARERLILIAGHTHRPVWSSQTHLQKLQDEIAALRARPTTPERDALIAVKEQEAVRVARQSPPCEDTEKPRPCYFNAGCCRYADGDITGIELEDGVLRLVKWSREGIRTPLEADRLADIFARL